MTLQERVNKLIADHLCMDEVSDDKSLQDQGCDSLDVVELTMVMEDEFKIEIPDEDSDKFIYTTDITKYLKGRGVC